MDTNQLEFLLREEIRLHNTQPIKLYISNTDIDSINARYHIIHVIKCITQIYNSCPANPDDPDKPNNPSEIQEINDCAIFAVYIMDRFFSIHLRNSYSTLATMDIRQRYFIAAACIVLASKLMTDEPIMYKDIQAICMSESQDDCFKDGTNYTNMERNICNVLNHDFTFIIPPHALIERFFEAFPCSEPKVQVTATNYCNEIFFQFNMTCVRPSYIAMHCITIACHRHKYNVSYVEQIQSFCLQIDRTPTTPEIYFRVLPLDTTNKSKNYQEEDNIFILQSKKTITKIKSTKWYNNTKDDSGNIELNI